MCRLSKIIIEKSTVPVKTAEALERVGKLTQEGAAAARVLANIYANWLPREQILIAFLWCSVRSRLVANAMLAQCFSSMNSIAQLCVKTGAGMQESPAPLNPIEWTASRSTKCMLAKAMQKGLYGSAPKRSTSAKRTVPSIRPQWAQFQMLVS